MSPYAPPKVLTNPYPKDRARVEDISHEFYKRTFLKSFDKFPKGY
jgi:hypothetical protein